VEERAWHLGVDEGDRTKKGNDGGQLLLWWPVARVKRKKGRGLRVQHHVEEKWGRERGGRHDVGQLSGRHQPLAGGHGRWGCGAIGAAVGCGDPARAQLTDGAG
jgi:hypothetical protein